MNGAGVVAVPGSTRDLAVKGRSSGHRGPGARPGRRGMGRPRSRRGEHAFDLEEDGVHHVAVGDLAGEMQAEAGPGLLAPDLQPALDHGEAARAAGAAAALGGAVGGLGEVGGDAPPLFARAGLRVLLQRGQHHLAIAAGHRGVDQEKPLLRQRLGLVQRAVEVLRHLGDGAQAEALHAAGGGEQAQDGLLDGGEPAAVGRMDDEAGLLPRGQPGADLVFLDHVQERLLDVARLADDGGDLGVAFVAGLGQVAEGGEAAVAGDQAVFQRRVGIGEPPDLDRGVEAAEGDGHLKLLQRGLVHHAAVAREGGFVDFGEGDVDEFGHGGLLCLGRPLGGGG